MMDLLKQYELFFKQNKEVISSGREKSDCLHTKCGSCDGTGNRKDGLGMCIHMISCPCPRCTPRC